MSEYIKTCECVAMLGKPDPRCIACKGTGQQLVKPIPEGAVILTPEQFAELAQTWCPPSRALYCVKEVECEECLMEWVKSSAPDSGTAKTTT